MHNAIMGPKGPNGSKGPNGPNGPNGPGPGPPEIYYVLALAIGAKGLLTWGIASHRGHVCSQSFG